MAHAHIPVVPFVNRQAYSLAEVAAVTGFSLSFLYELIKSGALRSRKVAGRRIVTPEALAELLGERSSTETHERPVAHTAAANIEDEVRHPHPAYAATTRPSQTRKRLSLLSAAKGAAR
jgi:excisionase family DNA binding protein